VILDELEQEPETLAEAMEFVLDKLEGPLGPPPPKADLITRIVFLQGARWAIGLCLETREPDDHNVEIRISGERLRSMIDQIETGFAQVHAAWEKLYGHQPS